MLVRDKLESRFAPRSPNRSLSPPTATQKKTMASVRSGTAMSTMVQKRRTWRLCELTTVRVRVILRQPYACMRVPICWLRYGNSFQQRRALVRHYPGCFLAVLALATLHTCHVRDASKNISQTTPTAENAANDYESRGVKRYRPTTAVVLYLQATQARLWLSRACSV